METYKENPQTTPNADNGALSAVETSAYFPEPFTPEYLNFLLVNALRHLNKAQMHNLALSLAVRDPLFSVEEYKEQIEE